MSLEELNKACGEMIARRPDLWAPDADINFTRSYNRGWEHGYSEGYRAAEIAQAERASSLVPAWRVRIQTMGDIGSAVLFVLICILAGLKLGDMTNKEPANTVTVDKAAAADQMTVRAR